jgi:NADH-quinone oxidoreductase subunit F
MDEALRLHRENNPFAAVCARVCFHPCESKCRRGALDEAVSIRGIKRFMADAEVGVQLPSTRIDAANAHRKVAIVGAGPAGLSCAYFLARLGYRPVVFEAAPRAGGLLLQGIPSYRLPREVIDAEVAMIERLGVTIKTGQRLGRDISLSGLREAGYESVFLGIGAPHGTRLALPGEEAQGVVDAMQFLRDYNLGHDCHLGKDVVIVGGGNSAIDAARTAIRLGASTVTVVYRRTRDQMPAYAHEVEEAEREGVRIRFLLGPTEVVVKDGGVVGLRCVPMDLQGFDRSGRRRAVPSQQAPVVIPTDMLITAIGQQLDVSAFAADAVPTTNRDGYLRVDPRTGQTEIPWLYAGGDAATGPASVVEAVRGGERAAVAIDRMLSGEAHAFWREHRKVNTFFDPDADPSTAPRAHLRLLGVEKRRGRFDEVELSWTEPEALREAGRCLRCDYRETCE